MEALGHPGRYRAWQGCRGARWAAEGLDPCRCLGPRRPVTTGVARLAEDAASPFESKFRLFAAGRWPLGVVGSTLVLF